MSRSLLFTTQMKRVIQLSFPMALSRFLQMLSGFISTMMAAHLGPIALAACALIGATNATVLLIFISIVFSLSFIVGQSFGAKKYDEIGALVQQAMILSVILGVLMMICFWFTDDVLRWFHEKEILLIYVRQYFHMLMWGAVAILLQSCLEQFCYGVLQQRLVITINFISLCVGIPLAYLFIFGKYGFPALGVGGLALTFSIQSWFNFTVLFICCYCLPYFKQFKLV